MDDKITQELRDLARVEGRWIEKQFNGQLDIKVLDTAMSPAGLASIVSNSYVRGLPSEEWWAGQSVKLQQAFAQQMRLGMTAGEPLGRLVQRVRGTQAEGFSDGIMQASSRDAKALIRTSVQSVANKTRETIYKANPDVVGEVQHVSTLDDRTTIICIARDGLRWTLDGEPVGHDLPYELPPLHWNCRSTLVPVTKTWREMGFDLDELSPTQRASMDGAVAADMTYEQWLKTKGEAFQDRVLGQGKAQLWRSGHIGLRDLLDQQGRPITLTRLEEEF
jgi:SPP1 gp7 family putative phage head morphogenesis protein